MFLKTIGEADAQGEIAEIYRKSQVTLGFVMSATTCWTARPDLLPIWEDFFTKIKAGFTLTSRDWRLITFIAAQEVPSTYCSFVYAKQLIDDLGSKEKVLAVQSDFTRAGLDERDVAMLTYARQVARNASRVTESDIEKLRTAGFVDSQICDIALCAALRCFMARYFDAMGAGPEPAFIDEDPSFRESLTIGRRLR